MLKRSYSMLTVKSLDEDLRMITGIATSPAPDRLGDIIEPLGVKFKNPLPLLWQHSTSQPVGNATFDKPTKNGITFRAKIAKTADPGTLKDRLDEAWQSVKLGLVKAVSIGFNPIEWNFIGDTNGIRFVETEVLELSLVTIPANADATIETIKSIDAKMLATKDYDEMTVPASDESQAAFMSRCVANMLNCAEDMSQAEATAHCAVTWDFRETPTSSAAQAGIEAVRNKFRLIDGSRAASGKSLTVDSRAPGVTGKSNPPKAPKEAKQMPKTILENIKEFEASRAAKNARMVEIMQKAAEAGETLDDATSEEYDNLEAEIKKIDEHLVRLNGLEKTNKEAAVVIEPTEIIGPRRATEQRSGNPISVKPNVPKGTSFTRYAMALAASKGNRWEALQIAKQWHDQTPEVELVLGHDMPAIMKAAVGVGTTTDATWASPLIAYQVMASEFIELLRPATIIGRIPGLRRVPFNIQMPRTTTGSTVGWVGENAPKPVSNMAFDTVQLRWAKAAGIIVLTEELVRFANPAAESVVRSDMIDAMAQFLDRQFVDPSVAAVTNVSPASITNGVTANNRSGVNQAAFVTDVTTLLSTFLTNNLSTAGGVWIMSQRQALSFSLMLNALGQPFYPNITAEGGTLLGYPVIASENIPSVGGSPADGTPIIFALPREILLADDGQVTIDASNQASIQMETTPDSPPTAATTMVSLWQMNFVGLRAERYINWLKRRSTAVAYIANANYA